jgi:hypothetical protein
MKIWREDIPTACMSTENDLKNDLKNDFVSVLNKNGILLLLIKSENKNFGELFCFVISKFKKRKSIDCPCVCEFDLEFEKFLV